MQRLIAWSATALRRLLWLVALYACVFSLIALTDLIVHPFAPSPYPSAGPDGFALWSRWLVPLIGGIPTFIVGFLVLRRAPQNILGLLMIIWAGSLTSFAISVEVSSWLYNLVSLPISAYWVALLLIPLYFPTGTAVPRSWGVAFFVYYSAQIPVGFLGLTRLPSMPWDTTLPNPWFIAGSGEVYTVLLNMVSLSSLPLIAALFVSPYLRFRRASAHERKQIKWLAWGGVLVFAPYFAVYLFAVSTFPDMNSVPDWFGIFIRLYQFVVGLYPAFTIANAILRHRLYDIDIIIRRTLIYAILTGILAAVYFGGIVLTQQLFRAATGQSSDLAIVVSTLLIAALFTPVRRRVQDAIDRRLYRRKYDVEKTLTDFQKNLREDVDMETLKANLVGVVSDTMQPSSVRLWVKKEGQP
jgi:hypothetical protein